MSTTQEPAPTGTAAIKPIAAVQCKQCTRLHFQDGNGYLVIHGQILRRRGDRSRWHEKAQHLGSPTEPTVLCDNKSCLIAFLNTEL